MTTPQQVDVLVVGAGFVGAPAARLLAAEGLVVAAVRRTPMPDGDGVHWVAADVATDAGIARLPTRATTVVFALSPGGRSVEAYRWAHIDVPRAVVAHLDHGPDRVLLTTSTAVYGVDDGSVVTESSPTTPDRPSAQVLVAAEEALTDLAPTSVALRLGGIYGPGRTRLIDEVRDGTATCAPGQWTNRIHRDDAAAAIVHLVRLADPPRTANVVDDTPAERCEVLAWLADRLGAPEPRVLEPGEASRSRGGSKRIDNGLLRATGWRPAYPSFREGYTTILPRRGN